MGGDHSVKLLSNSAIYLVGSIASRLLSLLSLPFLTEALSPEEYGVIAILTMAGVLVCALLSMGLGTSIGEVYFREQGGRHRNTVISTGFLVILLSHLAFVAFVWPLAGMVGSMMFDGRDYSYIIAIMLAGQIIQNLAFPLQLKLQFEERAKASAMVMLFSSLITVGLTVYLVVVAGRGLSGYAEAMVAGGVAQLLICGGLARIEFRRLEWPMGRELVRRGCPMILSFVLMFVMQYGIRLPLEWFGGLEVLGLYQVGASLAAPIGMITSAFVSAWTPYALGFADKPDQVSPALATVTRLYVVVVGAGVMLVFLVAPWVAEWLAAERYRASYLVIGSSALWHYYSSIFLLLLPPVYFANEVAKTVVRIQFLAVLVFAVLCIPLVKLSPLVGAGAVMGLAGFALVVFQLLWNKVLMSERYIQIEYGAATYGWLVFVGLGGAAVLMLGMYLGHAVSAAASLIMVAVLLRAAWQMVGPDSFRLLSRVLGRK